MPEDEIRSDTHGDIEMGDIFEEIVKIRSEGDRAAIERRNRDQPIDGKGREWSR